MSGTTPTSPADGAPRNAVLRHLMKVDIFRVVQDRDQHLTPATSRGGWLSAVCITLITIGFLNESYLFFRQDLRSTMAVSKHALQMERVHFNVTFTDYACGVMAFEAIEASTGRVYEEQQRTAEVKRIRLVNGLPVGEHPEGHNGDKLAENGEGCRVEGTFLIDKVPGHFTITAKHLPLPQRPPVSFIIHELWFGEKRLSTRDIPDALANSLGGFKVKNDPPSTLYQFFLNIVPTSFEDSSERLGFQYTSTHSHVQADIPPGLYFHHVHSPLSVMYQRSRVTWSHYLTNLCAVAGGVFTVVGLGVRFSGYVMKQFDKDNS